MAAREEQYADYAAPLIVEHRELDELLATVDVSDPADQQRLRAFEQLTEHISKEKDGLFPASVWSRWVVPSGTPRVVAWSQAHPGEKMIRD